MVLYTVGPSLSSGEDCVVSEWSEWGRCSVSCGLGYQERTRTVLVRNPSYYLGPKHAIGMREERVGSVQRQLWPWVPGEDTDSAGKEPLSLSGA